MKPKILGSLSLITLVSLLCPVSHAQTFSVIHTFDGTAGAGPTGGVTLRAGVLYGTTLCLHTGQQCGNGTVYQLSQVGSNWFLTPLSYLSAGGTHPEARVVFGPDNHLYGTTFRGGSLNSGSVFKLTPPLSICKTVACFWTEEVLYQFQGSPDGRGPGFGDLVWDSMGNIYGTTAEGGTSDLGTVFQMTKSGSNWTEVPIYSFTGPNGGSPDGGVILDSNGNLFGATADGGLGSGRVFELTYVVGLGWTQTVLYDFQDLSDGRHPGASLIRDSAGNLYGTTTAGGSGSGGTVFELSPVGNSWVFTLLYSLAGPQQYDCGPLAPLTLDNSGNLYGTTYCDGANSFGNVFKLTKTQNGWVYVSIHDFEDGPDGASPISNVTIDTDGTLYGTAANGGDSTCNCGTVWMIKP